MVKIMVFLLPQYRIVELTQTKSKYIVCKHSAVWSI